jgi:hypothetical protein
LLGDGNVLKVNEPISAAAATLLDELLRWVRALKPMRDNALASG